MAQPDTRKYQLFPRNTAQATASPVKGLDPEQAFALAMANSTDKADKLNGSPLRLRINKDHNLPARRRKVSVPELGPMTTVHESSMDSPTLPGRVGFHERSVSVPDDGWRSPNYGFHNNEKRVPNGLIRPPPSPKDLPPLMIPSQMSALAPLKRQLSLSRLRSGCAGEARSARPEESPKAKSSSTPTFSSTKDITTPSSTTSSLASSVSTLPTPLSATSEARMSPRMATDPLQRPSAHEKSASMSTPRSAVEPRSGSSLSSTMHRRNVSESGSTSSIMDRGRPKKKTESSSGHRRTESKRSKSAERRAFETLPKGWRVPDALQMLDPTEAIALNKQALQQAERFEIMRKADVDGLSRELRNLDERCEYLRRTYHSLRAGRRNLHSRICQYLRSPRTVKFSQESLLKQEEALAELDASIDDWVNKLEQAENRRTRVRQKLLEHVAAAVTIPVPGAVAGVSHQALQLALGGLKSPTAPACPSTPPRSPTKTTFGTHSASSSPSRVVAQVPSTIVEHPTIEEEAEDQPVGLGINTQQQQQQRITAAAPQQGETLTAGMRRADVESIRIYAGNEVAALLADVEQQITRMSKASEANAAARLEKQDSAALDAALVANMSDEERKVLHRTRSQEALEGASLKKEPSLETVVPAAASKSPTLSSLTPRSTPPPPASDESNFILTAAVFKP